MTQYYVLSDGREQGPFSLQALQQQHLAPDASVRSSDELQWKPAASMDELRPMFNSLRQKTTTPPTRPRSMLRLGIIVLLVIVAGLIIYYFSGRKPQSTVLKRKDIEAIHEREVQKAIRELNAAKLAKKQAEARKALLQTRRTELQSLQLQLRSISERKAAALADLDDIRRPHLFRSRSKKEAQMTEQLSLIESLEAKAAGIRSRILNCQTAIDSLARDNTQ